MCIQEKPGCRHQTASVSDGGKCSQHPSVQNLLEPCGEFTGLDGLDCGKSHESVRSVPTPVRTVVEVAQTSRLFFFFFVLPNVVLEGVFPIGSPTDGTRRGKLHHSLIRIWSRSHQHSPPGSSAAWSTGGSAVALAHLTRYADSKVGRSGVALKDGVPCGAPW